MARLTLVAGLAGPLLLSAAVAPAQTDAPAPPPIKPVAQIPSPETVTAALETPDPVPQPDPVAAIGRPDIGQCRQLAKVFFDLPAERQSKSADRLISCVEAVAELD